MIRRTPRCLAWTHASHKASTSAGLRRFVPPVYMSFGLRGRGPCEVNCLAKTAASRILLVAMNLRDCVVILLCCWFRRPQ